MAERWHVQQREADEEFERLLVDCGLVQPIEPPYLSAQASIPLLRST